MKKNIKQKIHHIFNRINFKVNYLIANTIMKKYVDSKNNSFNIMNDDKLVDEIVEDKKSYSRFGDGELSLILNKNFDLNFQTNSELIRNRLIEVLNSNLSNLIIGINRSFNDPSEYNTKVQKYCRTFNFLYREKYKKIIPKGKEYGNSSITRFYIDYDKSDFESAKNRIERLKKIWKNRKILIVEGTYSKLGVGNDLFKESMSIRRILVPEVNAFEKYDSILQTTIDNHDEDEIVLLAVGPTATVVAYDLALNNIQAIDVGHVDVEYEWFLSRTKKRTAIPGKYVNEIKGEKIRDYILNDSDYEKSIISRIEI